MKKIVACIPFAREFVYTSFFMSWTRMYAYSIGRYVLALCTAFGPYIDSNRDILINEALRMNPDYILFLDDDQTYPEDTPEILMNHDKDIVGGVTPRKGTLTPMIWDYDDNDPDGVQLWKGQDFQKGLKQISGMGMGGVLIKAPIFAKIDYPYFKIHDKPTYKQHGEDITFYLKCREAGIEVWVDLDLQYGHMLLTELKVPDA